MDTTHTNDGAKTMTTLTTADAPTLTALQNLLGETERNLPEDTKLDEVIDLAGLPTYGGDTPQNTTGIYSWDARYFLSPCGRDGDIWCLTPRADW